jgi:D-cysteine desulfhydrase
VIWNRESLDVLPRLGWAAEPTPIDSLPGLASELGLAALHVKRDDLADGLAGSTKTRKLDFLLADPRLRDAEGWASIGAIGSGHLTALTVAARTLDRRLLAHCFWEPLSEDVLGNLACIASGPTTIRYATSRPTLVLRHPLVMVARRTGGCACVAAGATSATGTLGTVRGGLELADQIRAGELERPDAIYVPWGTGGTATGLSIGLGLAGLPVPVIAVATVERIFATGLSRSVVSRGVLRLIDRQIGLPTGFAPAPLSIVHGHVGKAYGHPTVASCDACERLAGHGLRLEPVYGGKAFSAMLSRIPRERPKRLLYWLTSHRGELPVEEGWRQRLPSRLAAHVARAERTGRGPSRRGLLVGGVAAVGLIAVARTTGYRDALPDWQGGELARWEALLLIAAAEAVIPDVPGPLPTDGPDGPELAANVDRYLVGMPAPMRAEVHGLMALMEQGTLLGGRLSRLTRLEPAKRRAFLDGLTRKGGLLAVASRGIRDLCYVGWYQDPRTWPAIGYSGPLVKRREPGEPPRETPYDALVAAPGALPEGLTR